MTQHSSGFEYDGIPVFVIQVGLTQLKQALVAALIDASVMESDQMLCNLRQISSLNAAFNYITLVKTHLEAQTTLDIVSIDLRDAIGQLSDIVGSDVTEELLDGIFSKFYWEVAGLPADVGDIVFFVKGVSQVIDSLFK